MPLRRQNSVQPRLADDHWRRARPRVWALGREANCLVIRGPADFPAEVLRCPVRHAHFACLLVFRARSGIHLRIPLEAEVTSLLSTWRLPLMWRACQAPSGTNPTCWDHPGPAPPFTTSTTRLPTGFGPLSRSTMPAYFEYANTTSTRAPPFSDSPTRIRGKVGHPTKPLFFSEFR
jgi:hypothetical protein